MNSHPFIKNHWLGIALSIIAGLIIAGPNLIFILSPDYQGLPLMYNDYEEYYLTRMSESYDGCTMSCNPYVKNGWQFPYFDPSISALILALPGRVLGIPIIPLKLAYDFILPFILTFLIYAFIFRLTSNKSSSLLGATLIILGSSFINTYDIIGVDTFLEIFRGSVENKHFLLYARPVNPQFSSIVFFLYLHAIFSFLRHGNRKYFWLLTAVYALSFYIYFYTYTFLTVVNGSLICIYLFSRQMQKAKLLCYSTLIGITAAIPIISEIVQLITHPYFKDTYLTASGIINTHMPVVSLAGISFFILFILGAMKLKSGAAMPTDSHIILLALISSSFIIFNQHILTGKVLQNFHYHWYFATPVFIISIMYFIFTLYPENVLRRRITLSIICLLIGGSILLQYAAYSPRWTQAMDEQHWMPTIKYLNEAIPSRSMIAVAGPGKIAELIPIYTQDFVVWAPNLNFYLHDSVHFDWTNHVRTFKDLELESRKFGVEYLVIDPLINKKIDWQTVVPNKNLVFKNDLLLIVKID